MCLDTNLSQFGAVFVFITDIKWIYTQILYKAHINDNIYDGCVLMLHLKEFMNVVIY